MVTVEEVEAFVQNCFPQCPLCGSTKGYEVSGFAKTYAQCRSCGAKWMSSDFPKCEEITHIYLSEPAHDGKGTPLKTPKKYPITFWQDAASVQNALKMEETKKNEEKKAASSDLIFQSEMTDQQLDDLIKKSLEEITRWDYGSTLQGKGLGSLIGNTSVADATMIRELRAIFEQNKIIIIQNELLRRAILSHKTTDKP
jgi:hypothetical protein